MSIGIACLIVFLIMAALMYTRRLSALLALPIMALLIALIGQIPGPEIITKIFSAGAIKLHNAYTTTIFGAMLAELMNKQGIAKALIRWVAEFSGDNPFLLSVFMTVVTALLFSTLGGLGAVIMVGTIVLPVMLSLGIPAVTAGGLYLFGISLGGMFNLANWALYVDVLGIKHEQIIAFVLPFAGIMSLAILSYLAFELAKLKNLIYLGLILLVEGLFFWQYYSQSANTQAGPAATIDPNSWTIAGIVLLGLSILAVIRHLKKASDVPSLALVTPLVPLVLVLFCHWDIIPSFLAGLTFGTLATWQRNSINTLTRSILDGSSAVLPAVILMMGIGMLLSAVMHPNIADAIKPLLMSVLGTKAIPYVLGFTLMAPLALYRGPLSLWGMGSGLVKLIQATGALSSQAIMSMLMSVGQMQGVCDPTNTQNIWIATYLGTDTRALLIKTVPYVWFTVFTGLCLSVLFGYVPWQ